MTLVEALRIGFLPIAGIGASIAALIVDRLERRDRVR